MDEIDKAIADTASAFPFRGYIEAAPRAHREVAATVLRWLPRGSRILDFGAGPCDRTAVLQRLGYQCAAYDDLADPWHLVEGNREKILQFAREIGIEYHVAPDPLPSGPFDMVMVHDVLEHLHESPRSVLTQLFERTADGGYLFVTVPNAVNARKRAAVLGGRTNLPSFPSYYWSEEPWRGHVREYVRDDLRDLAGFLQVEIVELRGTHHLSHRLPTAVRIPYLLATKPFDGLRDTWLLVARKPSGWQPSTRPDPDLARRLQRQASPYWSRDS